MTEFEALTDQPLLDRWRGGDEVAGSALVKRHHASVDHFFLHKVGSDSEDLVRDTFLGLLKGIDRFRGDARFRTLLFAIARNKLLDHGRKQTRDKRRFDSAGTSVAALDRSPASLLEIQEQNKLLVTALRELPVDTQVMLELHYWEKFPIKEFSSVLELPISTVKTRMRRGRLRLEERMHELAESRDQLETTCRGLEGWAADLRRDLGDEIDG